MTHRLYRMAVMCVPAVAMLAHPALSATVRFNVVPASDRNARIRTIKTGTRIKYFITVNVISDTAETDNSGLALFSVNLETDLGVAQPAATQFVPVIRDNFRLFPTLGTPDNDDLIGIGAAQSTFSTNALTGIGQGQAQDLVEGFFQSPNVEGRFTVVIDAAGSSANVLNADFATVGGTSAAREITAGPGFTIVTDDEAAEDPGDELPIFQDLSGNARLAIAGFGMGIVLITTIIGLLIFGPWGAAMGLLTGAGLGLLSLFTSSMIFTPGAT